MNQKESKTEQPIPSYLDRVKALEARCPLYCRLDHFNTLPVGASRTVLTVLEFCTSKGTGDSCEHYVKSHEFSSIESLKDYLKRHTSNVDSCSGRMFILEDPSIEFINLLGHTFNIDPTVFAAFAYFPNRTALDDHGIFSVPPSRHLEVAAFTLKYHEIRDFPSNAPRSSDVRIATPGNIPREVLISRQLGSKYISEDIVTGAIQRNMGFWFSTKHEKNPWTALILVDPEVNTEICTTDWTNYNKNWKIQELLTKPYLGGPPEISLWDDLNSAHSSLHITEDSARCPRQSIAYYWKHSATQDELSQAVSNPRHAFLFSNFYVASHWMVVLEYLNGIISQLEIQLWSFDEMPQRPSPPEMRLLIEHVRRIMTDVNRWRRRMWWFIQDMESNMEKVKPVGPHQANPAMVDFEYIYQKLETCRERVESLLPVLIGISSLLEAQRSTTESRWASWLAAVATIFLPISATTGIFSMSGNFAAGEQGFYVPWVVMIGLILGISGLIFLVRKWRL